MKWNHLIWFDFFLNFVTYLIFVTKCLHAGGSTSNSLKNISLRDSCAQSHVLSIKRISLRVVN